MESISSITPSIVLPPHRPKPFHPFSSLPTARKTPNLVYTISFSFSFPRRWAVGGGGGESSSGFSCRCSGGGGEAEAEEEESGEEEGREELERAVQLDGEIPTTSDEFVRRVSSRAYDMRRSVQQSLDASSYDVLESNPWRESSKPVYVLTQKENRICTMKTRTNRSEVERELGQLLSKGGKRKPEFGNKAKQSRSGTQFRMLVEDVREGVLVFEDQDDAAKYCDLLQEGGKGCEAVAEIEAASVFDLCRKMRALAVLFRRGGTPPLPESLELNLKAKKRSLEDQDDLI